MIKRMNVYYNSVFGRSLLLLALFFLPFLAQSQSLVAQVDGIETSIKVTNQDTLISKGAVILLQRAESTHEEKYSQEFNRVNQVGYSYGYGYGYAYRSWHLEFVGATDLSSTKGRHKLSFYDASNTLIGVFLCLEGEIDVIDGRAKAIFFYSIDLKAVPILLLEQADRVNIDSL
jgi:hypothetical protein